MHTKSILLLVLWFGVIPQSMAQAVRYSVEAGIEAGRLYGGSMARGTNRYFEERVEVDDNISKGFWLSTQLRDDVGLEVAVRRCATQLIEARPGLFASQPDVAGFDWATTEILGMKLFRLGAFQPYIGAGVGMANLDINLTDRSVRDRNRATFAVAAGARFWFAQGFGFRFDVRAHTTYLDKRAGELDRGWTDTGRWLRNQEMLVGVFLSTRSK